ncbi:hypothetical protein MLD38_006049 [Melastoma candidum]|uniref:Uncharacterized protein n=1 Tax=Melastoma candidum TaxID=119954 RepID=A0ACB9RLN8_9MYRT|nr:hypothetical protein MLD38_006049 [Melastoma candidum]
MREDKTELGGHHAYSLWFGGRCRWEALEGLKEGGDRAPRNMKMEIMSKTTFMVKPLDQESKGYLPLSEWDQTSDITHASAIYFFKPSRDLDGLIESLTDSLSRVLVPFYPVAGRLRWTEGSRLLLECNSAGVEFTAAKLNCGLDQLGDFTPCPEYEWLVPEVDYSKPIWELPLFLVKVVMFKCGGFTLTYSMSHAIGDGQSAMHFVSEWARMARGEPLKIPPYFDRDVLASPASTSLKGRLVEFVPPPVLLGRTDGVEEQENETMSFMMKLTKSQVDRLKNNANQPPRNGRPYSRYECVAGHMWRCVTKARKHEPDQQTSFFVCVDFRNKMIPPVRPGYFGNAVLDVAATSYSGDLVSKPLGYAASRIRMAIDKVTREHVWSLAEYFRQQPDWSLFQDLHPSGSEDGLFYGNPNFGGTSWLTLPMYGEDFGWGKVAFIAPGIHDYDGDSVMFEMPDGSGIIASLVLQVRHVDDFRKYFYEDIP